MKPQIEVRGAVIKGVKILLIREKGEGRDWNLPGGHLDLEMTCSDFLKERILEDTGISINVIRPIQVIDEVIPSRKLTISYLCIPLSGKLRPSGGVKEVRWVEMERAVRLPLKDPAREVIKALMAKFTLIVRNRDVKRILIGVPAGHTHKRVILELQGGSAIVLHEATVESLVRAFVEIEMHPSRRALMLEGRELKERKEGYSSYQLLEVEMSDPEVEELISKILSCKPDEGSRLKGNSVGESGDEEELLH